MTENTKSELLKIYLDKASKGEFKELADICGISMSALGRVMINIQDLVKETIKKNLKMTTNIDIKRLKPPKIMSPAETQYRQAFKVVFNELKIVLEQRKIKVEG